MDQIDYANYENMCFKCCQGSIDEKTNFENILYSFIGNKANLSQISEIITKSESEHTQFITVEIINKVYSNSSKVGPIEVSYLDKNESRDENFEINQEFVNNYINL